MDIWKVKHKDGATTIRYGIGPENVNTLESYEAPLPDLNEALQALAEDVADICDLRDGAANDITVLGVTITDSEDTQRAVISAKRKLGNGATLCLNTPCIPFDSERGPQLSGATVGRIDALCREAVRFVNGERAQGELPLDDASAGDINKPIEDFIEGMKAEGVEVKVQRNARLAV